jgi:mannose-6-phosphate isomerase-like protein (cupin superfamily)
MKVRFVLFVVTCVCLVPILSAQDAVKVDPNHYTVVSENDRVRILKVHYGPREKSVMHSHPDTVAVFLSDAKGQFTYPDGKTETYDVKSGQTQYSPAATHLPENTGDSPMDLIVIELKGKTPTAAKVGKKK